MFYLNIGSNKLIKKRDIIGIFDLDTSTVAAQTKRFLKKKETDRKLEYIGNDLPKAFVLTEDKIYITTLSAASLSGRGKKRN
jgi:hypothetical protein